jgi:hypothetical protein
MGYQMYRKEDKNQLTMEAFMLPFGGHLSTENRWVKMAKLMPWDVIEEEYAKSMCEESGRESLPARIAYGAIHIKEQENLTDERTVEYLRENPYAQYFVGLKEFRKEALFDTSMMVHFRKRFPAQAIQRINEALYERRHAKGKEPPPDSGDPENGKEPCASLQGGFRNEGALILDATVAPADIRYPTDLGLLNECRENTERMIEKLWKHTDRRGHKTGYSRKKARSSYMRIAKQRQPRVKAIQRAVAEQLEYVRKNLETLERLLACVGYGILTDADLSRLCTICRVYRQQRKMAEEGKRRCEDRIVSLRQPHVRCIVRGKARAPYEFGQKLHLSVVKGYTFLEHQSWENFHEGTQLIAAVQRYRRRFGVYPGAILADKAYRNRENLRFCKDHGIRLSGPRLGRPPKEESKADQAIAYKDSCRRNWIEGRSGIGKRRYGLDLILSVLPETAMTEAALNVLVMNVAHLLRMLLRFFGWAFGWRFSRFRYGCITT